MDAVAIEAAVKTALTLVPILFQLGQDVYPFVENLRAIVSGGGLSTAQRASLNAEIDALHASIQAPMADEG